MPRKLAAEAIGTFLLVFFAVGSAVFGAKSIGAAGVATAFGFVLLALAYSIGPISGAHVNPAVTLGVVLSKRMSVVEGFGRAAAPGFAGLAIGLTLTVIHLVGIPLTGTSVNPARSLGPAIFEGHEALSQLWLFLTAPLVGAVAAAIAWYVVRSSQDAAPTPSLQAAESASPSVGRA